MASASAKSSSVGMVLDCGSGHTSILWYSSGADGHVRQLRRSKLKLPEGGNYKLTDAFEKGTAWENAAAFADALLAEIADARATAGIAQQPDLVFVGATGGLRNMVGDGQVTLASVREFEASLLSRLARSARTVKFSIITGEEEAAWELAAAHLIYSEARGAMFPGTEFRERGSGGFGIFSGGGSSMQVQEATGAPLSFPFSTWCGAEMDEALGADTSAWKDRVKWDKWETMLLAKVAAAKASLGQPLRGCFLLTAMCHVAASAAGFAESPTTAAAAIRKLNDALNQFRAGSGEPYASFVAGEHSMHPTVLAW